MRTTVTSIKEAKAMAKNLVSNNSIDALEKLQKEVSQIMPCTVEVNFTEGGDLSSALCILQAEPFRVTVDYSEYNKKYSVNANYKLPNANTDWRAVQDLTIAQPNQIGVLSLKKLNDWIDYHTLVYNRFKVSNDLNKAKIDLFMDSIKDLPVKWWSNNQKGYINKNGIDYEFEISNTGVYEKMKLSASATLENFLKLSDNKY